MSIQNRYRGASTCLLPWLIAPAATGGIRLAQHHGFHGMVGNQNCYACERLGRGGPEVTLSSHWRDTHGSSTTRTRQCRGSGLTTSLLVREGRHSGKGE